MRERGSQRERERGRGRPEERKRGRKGERERGREERKEKKDKLGSTLEVTEVTGIREERNMSTSSHKHPNG